MKRFLEAFLVFLVALVLGVGTAMWVIKHPVKWRGVQNGPWWTSPLVGSAQADMYVRATVARAGLFALNKTETIYFTAFTDDEGEPLDARCDYTIEGRDMDARWWSITAYGEDHFLIPNDEYRYSFHMKNVHRDGNGSYGIQLSGTFKQGDWLPTAGRGRMSLTLRLYNPAPSIYDHLETTGLPRIVKEKRP